MTITAIIRAGAYAVLVPLVGATGTWTEAMSAAPFVSVQAPSPASIADVPVHSAHLERRDASRGLQAAVDATLHADQGVVWLAWRVPGVARAGDHGSWSDGEGRCVLDDDGDFRGDHGMRGSLEDLVVLVRGTKGTIDRLTFSDARCAVDAGSRTVYWLDGVAAADSVRLLTGIVTNGSRSDAGDRDHGDRHRDPAQRGVAAIALHRDASADAALGQFVQPSSPKWLRRDAAFWLGAARGDSGAAVITKLARSDADDSFREHLTFVLTLTGESGIPTLIDLAKHDASSGVRAQALFWLAQKAGQRAVATLGQAVSDDPNSDVRKRAVFAISQLPKDDAVPKLIELAKTHRDPEVRKQAMFWLGQTNDPRAIAFFESVLKQ
jgi:hypothetical protein